MALKISDSRFFKLQPMRKNNWVFQFAAIPGNGADQAESLAFVAKTCSAPHVVLEGGGTLHRINEKYNFAGTPTWQPITCTFYDMIRNSCETGNSAGDILWNWFSMEYNPLTGQGGYKTQYATSATLAQIDPAGNIIRAWDLFGIYPDDISWGEGLDYASSEACEISATFKYDLAIKVSDSKSSTESA